MPIVDQVGYGRIPPENGFVTSLPGIAVDRVSGRIG